MSMCVIDTLSEIMSGTQQDQGMLKFCSANSKLLAIAEALTSRVEEHQSYILTAFC